MKTRWIGVLAVAAIAAAIIIYKETAGSRPGNPGGHAQTTANPSIVLVADLREAGTNDPCAEIIRLVRAAGQRGVPVHEIPAGQESPLLRQYRVTVEPTVLVLDANGRIIARHEGESQQTIAALRSDLEQLTRQQ